MYPEALNNLGAALRDLGQIDQAIARFGEAISLRPDYVEAIENLGHAQRASGQLDEAIASYQQALSIRPSAETLSTLGKALCDVGLLAKGIECFRGSLAMKPDARTGSNLLYILHFATDNPAEIWAEHVRWRRHVRQTIDARSCGF